MYWGAMSEVEEKWRKGPWTNEEDRLLVQHVNVHGEGRWNSVATLTGLKRNGKSCRLRWVNYLRPDLKRGRITPHEETIILELHARWGNRWSTIARSLPGRTDNEIKNYWRTHFKKKTKVSLEESTKLQTRLLKRQKFQQEQRQLQMQQNETDMEKIMVWRQQEKLNEEQQNISYPTTLLFNTWSNGSCYVPDTPMNEDVGLWDALWNFANDVHGLNFLRC